MTDPRRATLICRRESYQLGRHAGTPKSALEPIIGPVWTVAPRILKRIVRSPT